jgi:hypothetical protein
MADPRADNCKAFHVDGGGKVDGVLLEYAARPSAMYELVYVKLISEALAGGSTVASFAVYDKSGVAVSEVVWLAWPWPSLSDGKLPPGNANGQHMIVNGFNAAGGEIGPLAMYVGDAKGNIISDVIGGLGLPNNRHVCYQMAWKERGGVNPPDPGDGDNADVLAAIAALDARVKALALHLGLVQ